MQSTRVTVDEVKARLEKGEPFIFIDARNEKAWSQALDTLPDAIRVPADAVESHLSEIPHGFAIITYCTCPSEQSSARVSDELVNRGYRSAHPLYGGLGAWREAGLPLAPIKEAGKSQTGS